MKNCDIFSPEYCKALSFYFIAYLLCVFFTMIRPKFSVAAKSKTFENSFILPHHNS